MSIILYFIFTGLLFLGIIATIVTFTSPIWIVGLIVYLIVSHKKKNTINVDIKQGIPIAIDRSLKGNENIEKIKNMLEQANIEVRYVDIPYQMIISEKVYKYNNENVEEFLRDNEKK